MASPSSDQQHLGLPRRLTADALLDLPPARRKATVAALLHLWRDRESVLTAVLGKMARELRHMSTKESSALVDDIADPDGEATAACEGAETYFRTQEQELANIRRSLMASGGPDSHGGEVFAALDDLQKAFHLAVSCMQEARWLILMVEGGRDSPSSPRTFKSGTELLAAIQAEGESNTELRIT